MKDLEDIRLRCVMRDGHWLWHGSTRPDGRANIYAPDYSRGGMRVQCGTRAVWHSSTGTAIPSGWRAYGTCDEKTCCNPAHIRCSSQKDYGKWKAARGDLKGRTSRILANRAIGRDRSSLTTALIREIQTSSESGIDLAARLGMPKSVISKARRGEMRAFQSAGMSFGMGL